MEAGLVIIMYNNNYIGISTAYHRVVDRWGQLCSHLSNFNIQLGTTVEWSYIPISDPEPNNLI
jgi:hypothetical protein